MSLNLTWRRDVTDQKQKIGILSDEKATGKMAERIARFGYTPDMLGVALNDPRVLDFSNAPEIDAAELHKTASPLRKEFLSQQIA